MDLNSLEQAAFIITFLAYTVSMLLYIVYLANKSENVGKIATAITAVGLFANTAAIILRWVITKHPPLSNGYEFLLSFTWGIVLVYLFAEFKYKIKTIGAFVIPVAFFILSYVLLIMPAAEKVAGNMPPVLRSNWLTFHVFTAMLAYGAFAVSFGVSIMYLIKDNMEKNKSKSSFSKRLPALEVLDDMSYKFIIFAFPLLSLVIISGAIWAEYTWGQYWSWDPKETWSLITWFIYTAYLHARVTYGWKGKKAAIMSIVGFAAVMFTFFGVNYLLSGLHSYGKSE